MLERVRTVHSALTPSGLGKLLNYEVCLVVALIELSTREIPALRLGVIASVGGGSPARAGGVMGMSGVGVLAFDSVASWRSSWFWGIFSLTVISCSNVSLLFIEHGSSRNGNDSHIRHREGCRLYPHSASFTFGVTYRKVKYCPVVAVALEPAGTLTRMAHESLIYVFLFCK